MAESHLQVKLDASFEESKTKLLSKDRFEEYIKAIFGQSPWSLDYCEKLNSNKFKIKVSCLDYQEEYIVYLLTIRDESRQKDEYKSQLGSSYPSDEEKKLQPLILGVYVLDETSNPKDCLLASFNIENVNLSTNPSLRGVRSKGLAQARMYGFYETDGCTIFKPELIYHYINYHHTKRHLNSFQRIESPLQNSLSYIDFLVAMRTKPFLLFAGISGTGKSRIVKEMAFDSCPIKLRDEMSVSPGNYCMIEVKPNWHDSSELMGYVSRIGGEHYVVTPFLNFLIKALHHKDTPFFVCLDEMNLAPVEQYFAEFLSVLESRKLVDGIIVSEPLIKAEIIRNYIKDFENAYYGENIKTSSYVRDRLTDETSVEYDSAVFAEIKKNGLLLPPNVIVIGTVNMDDTTYQFSRKVIDRAMTIEMNTVDFNSIFADDNKKMEYPSTPVSAELYLSNHTSATDVLSSNEISDNDKDYLKEYLPLVLSDLNSILKNTPFRIAYRVENELVLYFSSLRKYDTETNSNILFETSIDNILMMKVLPRIEGNEDLLEVPLNNLHSFVENRFPKATKKIEEMQERLHINHFTSFWP